MWWNTIFSTPTTELYMEIQKQPKTYKFHVFPAFRLKRCPFEATILFVQCYNRKTFNKCTIVEWSRAKWWRELYHGSDGVVIAITTTIVLYTVECSAQCSVLFNPFGTINVTICDFIHSKLKNMHHWTNPVEHFHSYKEQNLLETFYLTRFVN